MIAEIIENLTKFPEAVAPYLSSEYFKQFIESVNGMVVSSGITPLLYLMAYPLAFAILFAMFYWPVVVILIGAIFYPIFG